jgi:hypothetical protein
MCPKQSASRSYRHFLDLASAPPSQFTARAQERLHWFSAHRYVLDGTAAGSTLRYTLYISDEGGVNGSVALDDRPMMCEVSGEVRRSSAPDNLVACDWEDAKVRVTWSGAVEGSHVGLVTDTDKGTEKHFEFTFTVTAEPD